MQLRKEETRTNFVFLFLGFLRSKCVVLVTHQLAFLKSVSRIYVLNNGKIAATGNYSEIQSSGCSFSKLFKNEPEEEHHANLEQGK